MRRSILLALCALAACGDPARQTQNPPTSRGYDAAAREYAALIARDSASPLLRYDLGTALLLAKHHAEARPPLELASRAEDETLRERAFYNLGNTHLEPAFAQPAMEGRDDELRKAIEAYKQALLLVPGDFDAKWNLELARRLLAQPPEGGGGGGGGAGGGGGGNEQQAGSQAPQPQPSGGGGGEMSQEAAERILAGSQQTELGVQEQKLRKPQPVNPTAH